MMRRATAPGWAAREPTGLHVPPIPAARPKRATCFRSRRSGALSWSRLRSAAAWRGTRLRVQVSQVGDLQLARRQAVEARRRGWRGSWPSGAYELATGHKENSTRHSGTRHVVRATDASSKDQHPKQNVTPNAGSWAGKALWLCTDHFTVYILLERRESTHTGNMLGTALNAR